MKRLLVLTASMMMLLCSVKAVKGNINDVHIDPIEPTNIEVITIVVSGGEGAGPVWITDSVFQVGGTSLELDIFLEVGPFLAITPWSHEEIIGTLPVGSYDLAVTAHADYGSHIETDTYLISFTVVPGPAIEAAIEIRPKTLNLQSKGKWLTCHIWLPEDFNVADIEPNSVRLENEPNDIYAEWIWFEEQEELAMAKFYRSEVQEMLVDRGQLGDVELMVSGELADGSIFEGTDTIRVIDKGGKKR